MEVSMKIRKNKKGFTLVELVVVIAILAVLAGTATVATIAILNNARKTPVTDAADSIQNQMQLYVMDSSYDATKDGFKKYLGDSMPDLVFDTATANNVTTCSDDKIHVTLVNASGLKSSTWAVIVYTQYYKIRVQYNYDTTNKGFKDFTVSDIKKLNETF